MSEAWNIRFGTAGTSDSFAAQGYKSSLDVPEYTAKMGLNAFEYQCGRGVRLGLDKAARMAALAAQRDILFSVHAPYYISMSSLEEDKRLNSIQYLLQSAAVCRALGGRRIIFHSGSHFCSLVQPQTHAAPALVLEGVQSHLCGVLRHIQAAFVALGGKAVAGACGAEPDLPIAHRVLPPRS